MRAILNADRNWGIGFQNRLLVHIPSDMRFFREHTTGNVVVMGRKTLESLPGGRPLADRDNIILSRDPSFSVKGAAVVHSVEELQQLRPRFYRRGTLREHLSQTRDAHRSAAKGSVRFREP